MRHFAIPNRSGMIPGLLGAALIASLGAMSGCENNSFFDPSRTGRFRYESTTTPILERLDVIEQDENLWGQTTSVTQDDLIPNDLSYRIVPGDIVTVNIFELFAAGEWWTSTRRIDASGRYRIPELGDLPAAGMTQQEVEDQLTRELSDKVMKNPQVDVVVEEGGGFRYTVFGFVQEPGMFTLQNPDLRLLDALAIAGAISPTTEKIYVIRQVVLSDVVKPSYDQPGTAPPDATTPATQPVDVEELIEQLDKEKKSGESPDIADPKNIRSEVADSVVSFSAIRRQDDPPVDIDDMQPVRSGDEPVVDVEDVQAKPPAQPSDPTTGDTFIFVPERGEWVRVRRKPGAAAQPGVEPSPQEMIVERIIEIPYQRLSHGDSSYNIVIRPNDRIYIDGPPQGLVYVEGEILRPGVFSLPQTGRLTLSRFVASAGGLGQLAIPTRVDLTRIVGPNRQATIRLNLQAIKLGTEPDVYLKPDDLVTIGTNFWAQPLAIVRNGFRATYGFGFLLDRNFGNDVFGVPPGEGNNF